MGRKPFPFLLWIETVNIPIIIGCKFGRKPFPFLLWIETLDWLLEIRYFKRSRKPFPFLLWIETIASSKLFILPI